MQNRKDKVVGGRSYPTATSATRIGSLASRTWVDPFRDACYDSVRLEPAGFLSSVWKLLLRPVLPELFYLLEPFGSECVALACPIPMQLEYQSHLIQNKRLRLIRKSCFLQFHRRTHDFIRKSIDRYPEWRPIDPFAKRGAKTNSWPKDASNESKRLTRPDSTHAAASSLSGRPLAYDTSMMYLVNLPMPRFGQPKGV
jgi:hypothetical protein